MSIPQSLVYNALKAPAAPARGYVSRIQPDQGITFQPGDTVSFSISAGRPGEMLKSTECSLFFRTKNAGAAGAANACTFDGGAWSVISRLQVIQGSTVLEDISSYNALHAALYHCTASSNYIQGPGNLMHGTKITALGSSTADTIKGASIAAENGVKHVALQLVSALVGTTAEKMIPLSALSADIRIEIELAPQNEAFVTTGTPVITYDKFEFQASIIQVDPSVEAEILASGDGTLSWHAEGFRAYQHSIPTAEMYSVIPIPARYSSLNYIMSALRPAANLTDKTMRSVTGREFATLAEAQMNFGHMLIPQKPLQLSTTNTAEIAAELMKVFGKLDGVADDFGVILSDQAIFMRQDARYQADADGLSLLALDISAFQNNLSDLANTGQSTLSTNITLNLSFSGSGPAHDVRLTSWANFGRLFIVDETTGLISVRE